jgi:curved DNA-binding protein CbpA
LLLRRKLQRVTDYFALLNEPRRPWLDAGALKEKFLKLAAAMHPDKQQTASEADINAANRDYAELNAAYNCLLEPKPRLLHLLELELGAKPKEIQQIPATLADLFAEVATACQNADVLLAEKSQTTSPLLQVQLFERAQQCVERLTPLQKKLGGVREQLTGELKSLDDTWTKADGAAQKKTLRDLEELYRWFSYFNRWNGQIQERITKLSL